MLIIDPKRSLLLAIDFQSRLMPAIDQGATAITNARRLVEMASLVGVPVVFTEQNANGLGPTVEDLPVDKGQLFHKQFFDACMEEGFMDIVCPDRQIIVAGCEAHVCVQQTVLGLLNAGRKVYVVRDALGSRRLENKETAIRRMERHGAEIVTTEMVVFEWLRTAEHPRFREAVALIK